MKTLEEAKRDPIFGSYIRLSSNRCEKIIRDDFGGGSGGGSRGRGNEQCRIDSILEHQDCRRSARNYFALREFLIIGAAVYVSVQTAGTGTGAAATTATVLSLASTKVYSDKLDSCDADRAIRDIRCG
ncbi:hypothetical protein [Parashewanella curva]|uniref:hypothetical protein n=1 Tax=Parashewanella curva TaxID=2338552 RepID=UPI0010592F7D|nr:hypothetical protein [Parashewanella curva]